MILLDNLYTILQGNTQSELENGCVSAGYTVCLNPHHNIYAAHFPENPITPGACLVQMCVEILSHLIGEELILTSLVNTKFLLPLCPEEGKEICFDIMCSGCTTSEQQMWCATFTIKDAENVYARMKLICRKGN